VSSCDIDIHSPVWYLYDNGVKCIRELHGGVLERGPVTTGNPPKPKLKMADLHDDGKERNRASTSSHEMDGMFTVGCDLIERNVCLVRLIVLYYKSGGLIWLA